MRFLTALLALLLPATISLAEISPKNVIVVANDNNDDSPAIAEYYMKARGIPPENLVKLTFSNDEEIAWYYFSEALWNPLIEKLKERNFLVGEFLPEKDAAGRRRMKVSENKIDAVVLCRGLPLRIRHDSELGEKEKSQNVKTEFATNGASVDSELALLALPESRATAIVPNPLFNKPAVPPEFAKKIICVARLDGVSADDCRRLVDNAILAEKQGLAGRAYIDLGGPHPQGDAWLKDTGELLQKAGFDTSVENTPALFGDTERFDAPAFYFGWYAPNIAGRIAEPTTHFVPGAIAMHIHSYSATTLRSPTAGWAAPLVAHGATITLGNVAEPYLQLTTNPVIFTAALLDNKQIGEAYLIAAPVWSWQTILVGDPLYRPFSVSAEAQTEAAFREKNPLGFYAILRSANLLKNAEKAAEAAQLQARAIAAFPTLPAILAVNEMNIAAGKPVRWPAASAGKYAATEDLGLVLETARFLAKNDKMPEALAMYETILARPNLSPEFLKIVPVEAVVHAEKFGSAPHAEKWRALISPPAPPEAPPATEK